MYCETDDPPLFKAVSNIVGHVDPMRLLERGCPDDEYDHEVDAILKILSSANSESELTELIADVFVRMFAMKEEEEKRKYKSFAKISSLIWNAK